MHSYVAAVQTRREDRHAVIPAAFHNVDVVPTADGNKPANKAQGPGAPDITMKASRARKFS